MKSILFFVTGFLLAPLGWAQQGTVHYKMTLSQGGQVRTSTSTMYFANDNVRTDVSIPFPGTPKPIKQTVLMLAKAPTTMYLLNAANKTYIENKLTPTANEATRKPTVKVVGKEKIQNLNCTHAVVSFDKGNAMDLWTSRDIPGYDRLLAYWRSNQTLGGDQLYNDLKKNGADGFIVRMKTSGMTMELERYDPKPVAASLFEIPKDYRKTAGFDASAFKNRTPAQQQKQMEALKKSQKP